MNNEHFCFGRAFPSGVVGFLRRNFFDRYANFYLGAVFSRVLSGVQLTARMPFERSKEIVRLFKHELIVYQRVLQDKRTPTVPRSCFELWLPATCVCR